MNADLASWSRSLSKILQDGVFVEQRQQARAKYCPELTYGRHFAPPGPKAKSAAVMILLEQPDRDAPLRDCTIPLTVRPAYLTDHPGQISLPGGRVEEGESYQRAAEREFNEELGVEEFPGMILGSLLPMWVFNSDFRLVPFVAIHTGEIVYRSCSREVERVIQLPVSELLRDATPKMGPYSRGSVQWMAGIFEYKSDRIWGATAVVLAELAEVLRLVEA